MARATIMTWGGLSFQVYPLNIHEFDHQTGSSFARKEVVEAIPQREWTGEDDEEISIRGRLFPHRFGGLDEMNTFEGMRKQGTANVLTRGDGAVFGWYVCEKLMRRHRHLSSRGWGRVIEFEALFSRCDTPYPPDYFAAIFGAFGFGG